MEDVPSSTEYRLALVRGHVNWGHALMLSVVARCKVLSGMVKRIAPDAEATPLNTPADLEAFAKSL